MINFLRAKDTIIYKKESINCNGKLLFLDKPQIMGILNSTPDSFFDGGKYLLEKDILNRAEQILSEGATIIDIGAYSSRPGAKHISEKEEIDRLIPAIRVFGKHYFGRYI